MRSVRACSKLVRVVLAGAALALALAPAAAARQAPPAPAAKPAAAAPGRVVVGGKVVFEIRAPLGPFSPAERASAASERIQHLVNDASVHEDGIGLDDHDTSTDIVAAGQVVTTVTDADARAAGIDRATLARDRLLQVRAAIADARSAYSLKGLLLSALYATLATIALVGLLLLLRRAAPIVYSSIERWRGTRIRALRIQKLELVSADRVTELLKQAARLARGAATLALFYVYLPLVFSFFPWTRSFGGTLFGYVFSPIRMGVAAFVAYLPDLLIVALVVGASYLVSRVARFIFREVERGTVSWPGFYPEWAMPTCRIVEALIVAFTLVVIFPYLPGSSSPAFRGVSIFLGVLFSLGSSSAVANVIAGVILTYTRAFRIGDRVQIADTVGDIVAKTLLATEVRTIKNVRITIPNSLVLGSHIINFSASAAGQPLILHAGVTIGYDVPWRKVHELLAEAAARTEGILPAPRPFVLQTSLDDSHVSYEVNAYSAEPNRMALIYSGLLQNIQDVFNEAGVEIMSPQFHAVRDGNTVTIPPAHRPAGYEPGGFRVAPPGPGGGSPR